MRLLSGLKRLSRAGDGTGDMDLSVLRTTVRTRTEAEIQKEVDALKDRVITSASVEYRRRRREDRRDKKPVQLWTHMASSVTGTLEETINTAFAQMLIVSSTEPRTLKNCDPPKLHSRRPDRTVTPRPLSRPAPAAGLGRPRSPSVLDVAPTAAPQHQPSAAPCCQGAAAGPPGSDSSAEGANTQKPSGPQTPTCTPPPLAPHAAAPLPAPLSRDSRSVPKDRPRMLGVKCVVDFEKIYRFLSVVLKPDEECRLTPMEGAILLDLMMSLQDELPKLDCSNLKKHLKQVYQGLSARSDTTAAQDLLRDLQERLRAQTESPAAPQTNQPDIQENPGGPESGGVAPQPPEANSQSSASSRCPPLNPFMVPVKLLKCREAQPQTG